MKLLFALLSLFFVTAFARAELTYCVYDIATKTATQLDASNVTVIDENYRNGSKILFVQDSAISTDYYIGVFELTNAQASALGWTVLSSMTSYAGTGSGFSPPAVSAYDQALSFPTVDQWLAYAGTPQEIEKGVCEYNVHFGCYNVLGRLTTSSTLEAWIEREAWPYASSHGTYDIFGNVAEYTQDGTFHGGASAFDPNSAITYNDLCNLASTNYALTNDHEEKHYLGVRLVYTPQVEGAYDVYLRVEEGEVRTNGTPQAEGTYAGTYKCDRRSAVAFVSTLQLPQWAEAYTATYVEVEGGEEKTIQGSYTPNEDGEFEFSVPAWIPIQAVITLTPTIATYPKVQFENIEVEIVSGEAFNATYYLPGTKLSLTPSTLEHHTFVKWSDDKTATPYSLTLEKNQTYILSPVYDKEPHVTITNGSATVTAGESTGDGYYRVGTEIVIVPEDRTRTEYQAFYRWVYGSAYDTTAEKQVGPLKANDVLTYEATYQYYPKVIVNDGEVEVLQGEDLGENHYTANASLKLKAKDKTSECKVFTRWSENSTSTNTEITITAGALKVKEPATATYTANYGMAPQVQVVGATVSVVSGEAYGNGYYSVGAQLKLTPTPAVREVFQSWTVTGGSQPSAQGDGTYIVDVPAVEKVATYTATFASAPRVMVENGTITLASGADLGNGYYSVGSKLTLKATAPKYGTFYQWKKDSTIVSTSESYTITVPTSGEQKFVATFQSYPRVFVNGAKVVVTSGTSYGDGYYSVNAQLELTPTVPTGYKFTKWSNDSTNIPLTIRAKGYNSKESYTAKYEIQSVTAQTGHALGGMENLPFGWYASETKTLTFGSNTYTYPVLKRATTAVVTFENLTTTSNVGYDQTSFDDSTKLTFKYVDPLQIDNNLDFGNKPFAGNGTMKSKDELRAIQPYYLAMTEVSKRQAYTWDSKNGGLEAIPYEVSSLSAAESAIAAMTGKFTASTKTTVRPTFGLPTLGQLQAAAILGYTKANQEKGEALQTAVYSYAEQGGNEYPNKTIAAVNSANVGQTKAGFYGLIGNAAEWMDGDSTNVYAGGFWSNNVGVYIVQTATKMKGWGMRPLITTENIECVNVTLSIGGKSETFAFQKNATINLGTPTMANKRFLGWRVGSSITTSNATTFKVTGATTYTAVYDDLVLSTITYIDCNGATSLPKGATTVVYPTPEGVTKTFARWEVTGGTMSGNVFTPTAATATVKALYTTTVSTVSYVDCTGPQYVSIGSSVQVYYTPSTDPTKTFDRWVVTGGTMSGNVFTPTAENATVKATYKSNVVDVVYVNCSGPKTIRLGGSEQIYYVDPPVGQVFDGWSVSGDATIDNKGVLTVKATATGSLTVTANYKKNARGYILRLK